MLAYGLISMYLSVSISESGSLSFFTYMDRHPRPQPAHGGDVLSPRALGPGLHVYIRLDLSSRTPRVQHQKNHKDQFGIFSCMFIDSHHLSLTFKDFQQMFINSHQKLYICFKH